KLDTPERDANSLFEHSFKLVRVGGSKTLLMIVLKDGNEVGFGLANFDLEKINKNRKFLLKRLENIPVQDLEILDKGGIDFPEKEDDRTQLHLSGKMLNGVYRIVPIRFKGERRYLFFKGKLEYVK
ncbi:MAG: hypothetical protein MUO85_08770, partial [candidate division Zixibacteria bacterium]|nr:hypothetical protein [candidate division Zixibacteria bacterium]